MTTPANPKRQGGVLANGVASRNGWLQNPPRWRLGFANTSRTLP